MQARDRGAWRRALFNSWVGLALTVAACESRTISNDAGQGGGAAGQGAGGAGGSGGSLPSSGVGGVSGSAGFIGGPPDFGGAEAGATSHDEDGGVDDEDGGSEPSYELPPVAGLTGECMGEVRLDDAEDVAMIAACETFDGSIEVRYSTTLKSIELPSLAVLNGTFFVSDALQFEELSLPKLREVLGQLGIEGSGLTELVLPALENHASLSIQVSPRLRRIRVPLLQSVSYAVIAGNPALETLELPSLTSVEFLMIGDTAMQTVGIPTLKTASDNLLISNHPRAKRLDFPSFTGARGLNVHGNPVLTELGFPLLAGISHNLFIATNPMLPTCRVRALLDRLSVKPAIQQYIEDNDDAATCP
jgi:hypothetical protein